ncbi:hypothetical protein [Pedobacter sp. L105]|uniref:phthiocerol/phthiodiolone dimycocerosyl transferase family protein n=1 Tax=Pedobacter sp. L105 TaxID=1641871 RepID=UPI00131BB8F0|nr:hypothetical protein [Pedobacter sp. L105]
MDIEERRSIGALEALFLSWDYSDPKHFVITAEIEGKSTADSWSEAVAALQQRHPILTFKLGKIDGSEIYFDAQKDFKIPLKFGTKSSKSIILELEKELVKKIDPINDPLIRITLNHEAENCTIIVAAYHPAADGMSVIFLINDSLTAVSGGILKEPSLSPSIDAMLGFDNKSIGEKLIKKLTPEYISELISKRKLVPPAQIQIVQFSEALTRKLIKKAKKEKTSVHGVLQAAAAVAMFHLSSKADSELVIMSPISARTLLNISDDIGMYSISNITNIALGDILNFWELARSNKENMASSSNIDYLITYMEQVRRLVGSTDDLNDFIDQSLGFDVMLSNLGRYPFPSNYGLLNIKTIYGPMIMPGAGKGQALGVITVNGKLTLTNTSRYPVVGLLLCMEKYIGEVC